MDSAAYDAFTAALLDNVRRDPDIIGIIFAGSTANASRRDVWSDHDFLLIVASGQQERYRQDLSWLPDTDKIVLRYRETEHGLNVIYSYGHLAEFAVFDLAEMEMMKANDYSVPVDKADITARMEGVHARSLPDPLDIVGACQHLLELVFLAAGRYARGEVLSAHTLVRQWALRRLLMILPAALTPPDAHKLDTLDPFRRVEQALPEQAAEIEALLRRDVMDTADGFLDILQNRVKTHVSGYPDALHEVVRARIAAARAAR